MTGVELTQCADGKIWAEQFVEMVKQDPSIATDLETMHAWFSNAVMAGYDHHRYQSKEYKRSIRRCTVPWWKRWFVPLSNFGR